jgi:hypothetical protein
VGLTTVVHALNNVFKFGLVRRDLDRGAVVRSGFPRSSLRILVPCYLFLLRRSSLRSHMVCCLIAIVGAVK